MQRPSLDGPLGAGLNVRPEPVRDDTALHLRSGCSPEVIAATHATKSATIRDLGSVQVPSRKDDPVGVFLCRMRG